MAKQTLGSQKTDAPKTPTLRQYFQAKDGKVPIDNLVSIVFKPNKAPNWSFVTEHNFRVSILEDNPLHSVISDGIDEWIENGTVLYVRVTNGSKGQFELILEDEETTEWEVFDWGYKASELVRTKTRQGKKTARP